MSFQHKVKELAQARGIETWYQLGQRIGLHQQTCMNLWNNPEYYPGKTSLAKICKGLNVKPNDVLVFQG